MQTEFTIKGLAESDHDLLGVWQPSTGSDFAFSGQAADAEPESVVWSVVVPDDWSAADSALQQQQTNLRLTQRFAHEAKQRLETLSPQTVEAVSFSTIDTPETTLFSNLEHLKSPHQPSSIAFTTSGETDGWWHTLNEYETFMTQLLQLLGPTLQVETQTGTMLLAFSSVGVTSNISTVWQHQSERQAHALHQRTVALCLQSRLALLQLVGQVMVGAAVLAARFNLPGGQLLALPAAWRYIQDVINQGRAFAALHHERLTVRR